MDRIRHRWRPALALFLATGLIWVGWAWWNGRRNRLAIMEIKSEMANARFGIAARRLAELLARNPGSNEAAYLLGTCEQRRGHEKGAAAAWSRVPPGSEFSRDAIQARMRLAEDDGRFADAEQLVKEAAEDPRNEGPELTAMLVPLYTQLGRIEEAERLVESRWEHLSATGEGASERAIFQLRLHILLTLKPNSVENIRAYLDRGSRLAPEDDRIWLGRANLAIRTGDFDEAKRWVDACLERRPDDVSVWRARLHWGMAADRIDVVRQAVAHLPSTESTPAQLHRLSAWLYSRRSDVESERRELERLVAVEPGDLTALDQLIRLAKKDGQLNRAAELGLKKAEIQRVRARYEKLYDRKQPIRDAVEMAQLAEQLGRWFEARAFLTLAIPADPKREDLSRDLARFSQGCLAVADPRQTLAEAVTHELGNDRVDGEKPSRSRAESR
jgi:enediyne biosynthesis protein E4